MPRRPSRRQTNRSKANAIERRIDELQNGDDWTPSVQTMILVGLKQAYDAELTEEQQRALDYIEGDD